MSRVPVPGARRYQLIELAEVSPGMVKGNRIKLQGLPIIRIRSSRPLPDSNQLKALRLVMHGRILSVDLVYAEQENPLLHNADAVGIDMGVNERMTLSDGGTVERRIVDCKRERRLQRAISRKQKGSNSRRKAVAAFAREKRRNIIRNRNVCHRITTDLVRRFGHIAIEALIRNMTAAGGSYKKGLNREAGANVGRDSTTTGVQGRVGRSVGRSQSIYVPCSELCHGKISDICMFRVRPC